MVGGSLAGPTFSLPEISIEGALVSFVITYPGLDMPAGVLPFFRRDEAVGGGGGGKDAAGSETRGRFGRRVDAVFAGSCAGSGLVSCAGALRFREEGVGRGGAGVVVAVAGAAVAEDDSEEFAFAALEEALVTLEDMICEYG